MRRILNMLAMGLLAVLSTRLCAQELQATRMADLIITNTYLYTSGQIDELLNQHGAGGLMQEVEWAELNSDLDAGTLVVGKQYRITDYEASVGGGGNAQTGSVSFDIIVTADSTNSLSEVARAARNADDNSSGARCEAWLLLYSLANDTDRFAWADPEHGKGVVYRMVDEFGNDCPYDFKSILFGNLPTLAENSRNNVIKPSFDSEGRQVLNGIVISNRCCNVTVDGGNMNLTLAYTNTFNSVTDFIQNITVGKGVYTNSTRKTIYVADKNQAYETEFRSPDSTVISVE